MTGLVGGPQHNWNQTFNSTKWSEADLSINTGWGTCRTTRLPAIIECDTLWKKEMLKIKKLVADDYDIKTSYYFPNFFSVSQCGKRNNVILGKSFSSLSTWNAFLLPANNPCLQTARVQTHFCICCLSAFTMAWNLSGKKETSPQAKRHQPSLLFTSLAILTFITRQLPSPDNFCHLITFIIW